MTDTGDNAAQPDKPSTSGRCRTRQRQEAGARRLQRLPKLKEGEYVLTCQWDTCQETCMRLSDMFNHVTTHIQLYLLQTVGPQSSLQSPGICCTCGWRECGAQILGSILDFNRHVYFHVYHMQLKCQGGHRMEQLSLGPCNLGGQSQNWIPELPDNLQCYWDNCKIIFDNAYHFYGHVGQHAEENLDRKATMRCLWADCKASLKGTNKLKEHLRTHTQEKVVACPTCGGLFSSHTKLIDHIQRQAKPDMLRYECSYCNRRFSTERMLKDHMRRHVNSYKCTMCEMTCPAPSALRIHMMYKHSEEKPFKCGHCEFSAKSSTDLRKHLDSHNVEDQFSCHVNNCPFSARCYISLAMHFKKHHESLDVKTPRYKCHVCNREFSRGYTLTFHLKKNHRFQWPPGHSRFRYKLHEDGFLRLQTFRYECTDIVELPATTPEKVSSHKNTGTARVRRRKHIVTSMINPLPPFSPPGDEVSNEVRQGQSSSEGQDQTSGQTQSTSKGQTCVEGRLSRAESQACREGQSSEVVRERRVEGGQTNLEPGLILTSAEAGSGREVTGVELLQPPPSPPGPLVIALPQTDTHQSRRKERKTLSTRPGKKRSKKQNVARTSDDTSSQASIMSAKQRSKKQIVTEMETVSNNPSTAPAKKRSSKQDLTASNKEVDSKVGEPRHKCLKKTAAEEMPSVNKASDITKSSNNISTTEQIQPSATKLHKKKGRQTVIEIQKPHYIIDIEAVHKKGKKLLKGKTDAKESTTNLTKPDPTPDTNMDVEDPMETEDLAEIEDLVQKRVRKPTLKVAALMANPSASKVAALYTKPSGLKFGMLASTSSDLKIGALTTKPSSSKHSAITTKPTGLKGDALTTNSSELTVDAPSTQLSDSGKGRKASIDPSTRSQRPGKLSLLQSRKSKVGSGVTHTSTNVKSKLGRNVLRTSDVKSQLAKVITDRTKQDTPHHNETDREMDQSTTAEGEVSGGRRPEELGVEYGDTGEANLHMLGDVALTSLLVPKIH